MDVIQNPDQLRPRATVRAVRAILLGLATAAVGSACSSSSPGSTSSSALPADVSAIIFLQRMPRTDNGNVFDYTSYVPGGRLVKLEPPSANGTLTVLTSDPKFDGADVMSYDLSFDAQSVVFSARLADSQQYQLFSMNLDGSNLKQLTDGGNDFVYPTYLPGGRIFFTTNLNVEDPAPQFRDEYERQTTAQVGTINIDGNASSMVLGPRNVSHRVAPTLLPTGRVLYTEWRHMGTVNDGHLRMMNADMTGMREAFGGEVGGEGGTNSYLKGRFVQTTTQLGADGQPDATLPMNTQIVAVATSRDRTLQSGKLFLIDLNGSEAASKFTDMTPLVPGDRTKSDVGRYYDAEVVGDPNDRKFLASWADGPVESEVLALAQSQANFGLYVFDGKSGTRFPIYDDPKYWDVLARPIKARIEPPVTESPVSGASTTIAALNVYDSSVLTIPPGSVQKVRLIEGFSAEEGPRSFGTTEFDGQSLYGEIPIQPDNSFAAQVPGNVPFHMQLIDKFAMSIANESIWISGRAGEQRSCGGCHENRTETAQIAPGQIDAVLRGSVNLDVPRAQRVSTTAYQLTAGAVASPSSLRGIPWDLALQPIFDAKCATCHDGDASKAGNPSYTVTDMTTGTSQMFVFDLRGQKVNVSVGERMTGDFTASYLSIMGLGEILGEDVVNITGTGTPDGYAEGGSAKDSKVIQLLNPPQRFPSADLGTRAFPGGTHAAAVGGPELTPDEYYLFILNLDMGGQFFFRENKTEATAY
jgi:Hydrazine synthase alpha subunit middle domain